MISDEVHITQRYVMRNGLSCYFTFAPKKYSFYCTQAPRKFRYLQQFNRHYKFEGKCTRHDWLQIL